jgi:molecular chaperone HtpG
LLRFYSTQQIEEPTVSLDLYLERKTEEQQAIYYLLGENLQQLKSSPHLDLFTKHGMEVLLLDEPMDDLVLSALSSYQDLPFINVESGDLKLPENIKEEVEIQEPQADLKTLADRLREILQDQVNSIRFSKALSSSPCRFFSVEGGLSHSVRKKLSELQGFGAIPFKRDLELNPDHPFVASMAANVRGESFEKQAKLLYHLASLYEGSVEDPQELAGLILPYLT